MCRIHLVDLVPSDQKRTEPQDEDPDVPDPGHAAKPHATPPPPHNCPHCGAPVPDPAAKRCVQCTEPLIRLSLIIEFPGGRVAVAAGDQTTLGRHAAESPHAQLFARYPNVSRLHATIGVDRDGGAWICDEESANGTFVNGAPIDELKRHALADGDEVRLGADAAGRVDLRPPP